MYKNAVEFKGVWLAPGSQGFELYHSKDPKAKQQLEKLIKEVAAKSELPQQHKGTKMELAQRIADHAEDIGAHPKLEAHQQRVVDEKAENDERLSKLNYFINHNPTFHSKALIDAERIRLRRQAVVMTELSNILGERIAAFTAPCPEATAEEAGKVA